ncbi:hypothetical protein L2E82_33379 [Cichorium intybus]|uniref:Uncharacterized protein n=1 Tax=Cichorium intybus TaxID=13427 RepID=A0ACB9BJZ7_CICIN|nr:hypothetical protein L2E82_33379 [Cichorium intybus]
MEEAQRLLNPWVLHLQKLGLELKCPLCLQLFNRPVLLPCNHIFCTSCMPKAVELGSECPACKHQYVDREAKPASFIENIVNIYRNIDATFNANVFHPVRSDVTRVSAQSPASINIDVNISSRNDGIEIVQSGNSSNGQSTTSQTVTPSLLNTSPEDLVTRIFEKCITPESGQKQKFNFNDSDKPSLSNYMGQVATDKHMETVTHSPKRPVENDTYGTDLESNTRSNSGSESQTIEVKRQKKTNDGLNDASVVLDQLDLKRSPCAFCHSSKETDGSGPLVSYAQGKEVVGNVANFSKVTHVHEKCIQWAPRIFFKNEIIHNLESEVARASKLKCASCGKKGAVLGCYMKSCQKTYHVPCAYFIFECRWDEVNFLMLCPSHTHIKFPGEKKAKAVKQDTEKRISTHPTPCTTQLKAKQNLIFCGSALSPDEKSTLIEFARSNGSIVSRYWRPNVTHVIASIDSNGACTRTLKVLMAILNGKWIVTVKWVKACVEAGCLVNEEPYEVHLDTHGCSGGPKAGRLRVLNNGPKLFNNLKFYFVGEFVQAFKADLLNLVETAGGTLIETKDQLLSSSNDVDEDVKWVSLVVYNADVSDHTEFDEGSVKFQRLSVAQDIAQEFGSQIVGHTWILESIAGCSLLPFTSGA